MKAVSAKKKAPSGVKKIAAPKVKKIAASGVKKLAAAQEVKKIGVSPAFAKKLKHSFQVKDPENTLLLTVKGGDVLVAMLPDLAPGHVARVKELVREGFYNGLKFHRVIDGFMAQTGCPKGTGTGGSGRKLKAEFSTRHHKRGTVSMARAMDVNSGDSQFFICYADCSWLDGKYTVWGEAVSGMEHIDALKKGDGPNGMVAAPDEIISMRVVADL